MQQYFKIIAVCPEIEIGLSTPRPAVQLTGKLQAIKITGRDDPGIDISEAMQNYCKQRPAQLADIDGYIFKSKSPSCGIKDIPLFNDKGEINDITRGIFADAILQQYPKLPITDENKLITSGQQKAFLDKVHAYQQLK